MRRVVITKKLEAAIAILAGERMADCSDEAFITAIRKRKIKASTIYTIMAMMRYQWNGKRWFWRPLESKAVRRVFAIANKFEPWERV